jgi:hypothetical protein
MTAFRLGLIQAFTGIASIFLIAVFAVSFFQLTPQAFIGGLIIGGISGIGICLLFATNWDPEHLKPKRPQEGWEVVGMGVVGLMGGFIAPYGIEKWLAPNGAGIQLVALGVMIAVFCAYTALQLWRCRPRVETDS